MVLGLWESVEHGLQKQQFVAGHQRVDRRVLERDPDVASHVVGLFDDIEPGDPARATCRPQQRGQHSNHRALACTVWPEESEHFARLDPEVYAVDCLDCVVTGTEVPHEPFGDDGRFTTTAIH